MRYRKILLPTLLVCLGLTSPAAAQKNTRTSDTPVTSILTDAYIDPVTGLPAPMQIGSDGRDGGVYKNTQYVKSLVQAVGDWELDAYNSGQSDRQIYLEFSQPIPGTGPADNNYNPINPFAPRTSATLKGRFISKCHEYGSSMFTLPGGQTMRCPMIVRFDDFGGNTYRIHMSPDTSYYHYPGTNYVNITCTGTDPTSKCNRWKIEPGGDCITADCSVRRNRVKLVKFLVGKGGKTTEVNQGDFYMSFLVNLTNP